MNFNFTKDQLLDYAAYEKVRASGKYNMFDRRAQSAAGLSREAFLFVMTNYEALSIAAAKAKEAS